ncbi:extracellular matrix regulator RemB [Tissierella praeacuta]|uniref:extracellular matrix regulator RemB n=1 Tax=Tissierella praeacuta TaxID=43131 RepID=UPI003340D59D
MIIHIGDNNYIFEKNIIAILDKKAAEGTKITREFINRLIEDNCLIGTLDLNTKSYIVVSDNNNTMVYTSNISSKALANRNTYE